MGESKKGGEIQQEEGREYVLCYCHQHHQSLSSFSSLLRAAASVSLSLSLRSSHPPTYYNSPAAASLSIYASLSLSPVLGELLSPLPLSVAPPRRTNTSSSLSSLRGEWMGVCGSQKQVAPGGKGGTERATSFGGKGGRDRGRANVLAGNRGEGERDRGVE